MNNPGHLVLSFPGPEPDTELQEWICSGIVAGVVLFADNFVSTSQMIETNTRLRAWGGESFCIMIDEEGGRVRRLPPAISPMLALSTYGIKGETTRAASDYAAVSRTLLGLGITTLLAPVVDVRSAQNAWLADRTFSDHPAAVADFTAHAVRAIQQTGLAACAKHFPGLGGVRDDLHRHQFVVEDSAQTIQERDLPPFRAAVTAGVKMVMVSHAVYHALDPTRQAVFSPLIVNDLLRRRLGFSGVALSDDLAMGAITSSMPIESAVERALEAGCDLVLVCRDRPLQRRAAKFLFDRMSR